MLPAQWPPLSKGRAASLHPPLRDQQLRPVRAGNVVDADHGSFLFQKVPALHFTLLCATRSFAQYGSVMSSMRTMGVSWVVALINLLPPR